MTKPEFLTGDLVRFSHQVNSKESFYGILFYLNKKAFLLQPNGHITEEASIDNLEWVCHTALVHGSYFESLKQVQNDYYLGTYDHVIGNVPNNAFVANAV